MARAQATSTGSGQAWPVKPIRLVHGFIAGGSVDIIARLLAAPLSARLGQQVVVEGRPGAGGTTAAGLVARAEPDGYTLFLMASGHATSPALYRALAYDPVRDFTMITLVAGNPFVVAAAANFPARTIIDLVRMAKAEPGRIDFGTGGAGTGMHLAAVLLQARAGIKLNHVPYKGGNAAPHDLSSRLVGRLSEVARATLAVPGMTEKFLQMGSALTPTTPAQARTFLAAEVARWTKVIRDENISPEN